MGLFDKALKNVVKRTANNVVSSVLGKAVNNAVDNATDAILGDGSADRLRRENRGEYEGSAPNQQYSAPAAASAPSESYNELVERFNAILTEEFTCCTVMRNVSAASLNISPAGKNYDFCLMKDGRPAGVVMVTPKNRDRNAAFLNAKAAAVGAGIPFINFYAHYPNEKGYVVNRIQGLLK